MKRAAVLLALLLVAALNAGTDQTDIKATYTEDILYVASMLESDAGLHEKAVQSGIAANSITVQMLEYALQDYTYALIAQDVRGNQAIHDVRITGGGDLIIDMRTPSKTGYTVYPRFDVRIQTLPASCEWRFYAPGEPMQDWDDMERADGTTHWIDYSEGRDFSDVHRFAEGEQVPIHIRCDGDDGTSQRAAYLLGWTKDITTITTSIWPETVTQQGQPVRISITSNNPTRCALFDDQQDPQEDQPLYTSELGVQHRFDDLPSTPQFYIIDCTDHQGTLLPRIEETVNQNYASTKLEMSINYPTTPTPYGNPVLSVSTNLPAECVADYGQAVQLGALSSKYLHQRIIPIGETTLGTITCTTPDDELSVQREIVIDTQGPVVRFSKDPITCDEDDSFVLELASTQGEPEYVIIKLGTRSMLRTWPEGASQAVFHFAGITGKVGESIIVYGTDAAGNKGPEQSVDITGRSVNDCEVKGLEQDLVLESPTNGAALEETFTLIVKSEFPSSCTWRVADGPGTDFEKIEDDETSHIVEDFGRISGLIDEKELPLTVTCVDEAGQPTTETWDLAYGLGPPELTLSADPNPVKDIYDRQSTITVETDQLTQCSYDKSGWTQEYAREAQFTVSIPYNVGDREVFVECRNILGIKSNDTIIISEDYPTTMGITIKADRLTRDNNVPIEVETTLPATCEVLNPGVPLVPPGGFIHTADLNLRIGSNLVEVRCDEEVTQKSKKENVTIIVDPVIPTIELTSEQLTCGLNGYTATGTAVDEHSGIAVIWVQFDDKNLTIRNPKTESWKSEFTGMDLTAGQNYNLIISGKDNAGNPSGKTSTPVKAEPRTSGACDKNPPRGELHENTQVGWTLIEITCEDEEGACDDEYELSIGAEDGGCDLEKYKFSDNRSFNLTETSKVCWKVFDLVGLTDSDDDIVEVVNIERLPSHCSNDEQDVDETGVDCGGSCQVTCEDDLCEDDKDCTQGACEAGVCTSNHCENTIMDADETDVNCGGLDCEPCAVGQSCEIWADCASESCFYKECLEPACDDGRHNGDETDVDCGGTCPDKCENGDSCLTGDDCVTGICSDSGVCTTEQLQTNKPLSDCGNGRCEAGEELTCEQDCYNEPIDEGGSLMAWILIILGILMVLGGGGYIFYEQRQPHFEPTQQSSALTGSPQSTIRTDPLSGVDEQPEEQVDFGQSKLREEAREKRKKERSASREELLSEFEDEPKKPKKEAKEDQSI